MSSEPAAGVRGFAHVGIIVPELDSAASLFRDRLGAEVRGPDEEEELGLRISPSLERIYASATAARAPAPQAPESQVQAASAVPPSLAPLAPAAPSVPARRSAAREERRPVTVLFAEVAAPAGLAGTLGLEALRDLVGGSLATVIAQVEAFGGTVTSVSGRGLQAMFGAPEAHEDDPERAVRAAYRAVSATAAAATAVGASADPANLSMAHREQLRDFCDAVEHDRSPRVDGHAGRRTAALVLALYEAATTGRAVRLA